MNFDCLAPANCSDKTIKSEEQSLRRLVGRMLPQVADQDDLLQETWLASLEADARENERRNTGAWRRAVLRNKVLQYMRRCHRRREIEAQAQLLPPSPPADRKLELDSAQAHLLRAMEALPRLQARVLRARFFDDMSLREISERTGRPLATVKTQASRGLRRLRDLIELNSLCD